MVESTTETVPRSAHSPATDISLPKTLPPSLSRHAYDNDMNGRIHPPLFGWSTELLCTMSMYNGPASYIMYVCCCDVRLRFSTYTARTSEPQLSKYYTYCLPIISKPQTPEMARHTRTYLPADQLEILAKIKLSSREAFRHAHTHA